MRKRYSITAALLIWTGAVASNAFSQIVKAPNNFGLEIESVTIDSVASTARIVVHNTSGKPISAYVVSLAPVYSDGEQLKWERIIDFFASLGMEYLFPVAPGSDPNMGAIRSGTSRVSTFLYEKAHAEGAQLVNIRVGVTGVVFEDESTAGDSNRIPDIVDLRNAKSTEVVRWCMDAKRFADGPVTRKGVDDILAAHGPAPALTGLQGPSQTATEAERIELSSILQQGIDWHSGDMASLKPWASAYFDTRCATAKAHLERRGNQ